MGFFDLFGNSKEESPEELLRKKLSEAFDNGVRYAVNEPSSRAVIKEPVLGALLVKGAIANMYHTFNDTLGYHYTLEAFAGLGQLYVQDERFTENLRQYGDGFPEFLAAAMTYYAQKT